MKLNMYDSGVIASGDSYFRNEAIMRPWASSFFLNFVLYKTSVGLVGVDTSSWLFRNS